MKFLPSTLALAAATLLTLPSLALAEIAFNAGVTSDYRYRGISQTRLKPTAQAGLDYSAGGFYLGAWASGIRWIKDGGGGGSTELDLYGGYKGEIRKDLGYDVGVLRYQYPGNRLNPSANTTELYAALTAGVVTAKYSHSITNLFGFANSKGSGYLDLSAGFELGAGLILTPHLGYQRVAHNTNASYTDYSLTLSKDFSGLVLSAAMIGADVKKPGGVPAYASPAGKNLGQNGLVLAAKYNF